MCASNALLIGCEVLASCPMASLLDRSETTCEPGKRSGQRGYRSPFGNWHNQASVRQRPRRVLDGASGKQYFPPELVPVARHPEVQGLTPDRFSLLMLRHLYRYLRFTIVLESRFVNPVVLALHEHAWGMQLDEAMRLDALVVYTDEAYHALFSADLINQAESESGIRHQRDYTPPFVGELRRISKRSDHGLGPLLTLLFVIVSETLITSSLAEIPQDASTISGVREAVRDHAVDEGRHYSYFVAVLRAVWSVLTPTERKHLAALVPELIEAFLRPDHAATRADLVEVGLSADDAARVVAEVMDTDRTRAQYLTVANATVRAFESVGALDLSGVRAAFEDRGLLVPPQPSLRSMTELRPDRAEGGDRT